MKILLFRHSITKANLLKKYNGITDEQLCEEGYKLLEEKGINDDITIAYSSPMLRAKQTAQKLFPKAKIKIVEDLKEMNFGVFEGKSYKDMKNDPEYIKWVDSYCLAKCPDGEDLLSYQAKVKNAFEYIVKDAINLDLNTFAIVAHGGSIMSIMHTYVKNSKDFYDFQVDNACGFEIELNENTWINKHYFIKYNKIYKPML